MQDGIEEGDVQDRKWQKTKLWRLSIRLTSAVHYLLFPEWNLHMLCLHAGPMPNVSVTTHAPTNTHSHILRDNTNGNSDDDRSMSVLIFKVRTTLLCPWYKFQRETALVFPVIHSATPAACRELCSVPGLNTLPLTSRKESSHFSQESDEMFLVCDMS